MQHNAMHIQGPQIHQFNNIAEQAIPRSSFQRNSNLRTTFNQDWLIPIYVDEILPGDDVHIKMTALTRMSTPVKPVFDNLYLETFWFFVPNRLTWDTWEKFQGERNNPGDSVAYTIPTLDATVAPLSTIGFTTESLYNYFNCPTGVTGLTGISSLYGRAYQLIYNDWFRNENLQNSQVVPTGDGPEGADTYPLQKRNKRKDYFTSCLPWPQKGDPVSIGLSGTAPVSINKYNSTNGGGVITQADIKLISDSTSPWAARNFSGGGFGAPTTNADAANATLTGSADLNGLPLITINALRQAAIYQQILELDARGGTRYVESIYTRFGVVSPDFRLQRPELIGQGSTRFNVYAVPQTAPTSDDSTPQGNLAAYGTNVINGNHSCRYAATEHGMLIGLANVRADLTYQQGVPKMFTRSTRNDFYEPLQNGLGEQAVLYKELIASGTSKDDEVFGYIERFSEYRFKNSQISGKFRSNAPDTLDVWHLSQELDPSLTLNSAFITEDLPMERVLAVTDEPSFMMDAVFDCTHVRPMPIRSNPGIDRL